MKTKKAIGLYSIQFFIVIFAWLVILKDRTLITINDGYNQYYLTMVYFGKLIREFVQNILNGQFMVPQFDFAIGLGEGILPALNYYGIGDPFLFIAVFFPVAYSTYAHTVIIFAKIYVAGLSFIYFCRKRKIRYEDILLGTSVYIGCQYFLCHGLMYPTTFLNVMISLPLMCAGIDSVIEKANTEKKFFLNELSLELIGGVMLQALCGFYTLYMALIFAGIYAFVRVLCYEKNIKKVFLSLMKLFSQVVLGIACGSIVFIPAIIGFLNSGRSADSTIKGAIGLFSFDASLLWKTYATIIVPQGLTEIGLILPIIAVLCIGLALFKEKKIKDIKIITILFILLYFNMKFASWVAGGFTSSIYYGRWIFIMCFLCAYLTVCGAKYLIVVDNKVFYGFGIGISVYLLSIIGGDYLLNTDVNLPSVKVYIIYLIYVFINIVIFIIVQKKENKKYRYIVSQLLILGSIVLNMFVIFNIQEGKYYTKTYYDARNDMIKSNVQNYSVEAPFGRLDVQGNTRNDSLYIGHYSANEYLSIINENIVNFYKEYAMAAEMYGSVHHLIGLGGKSGMEDLLSVQYYDRVNEKGVQKNEDYLPLGIVYSEYITEEDAEELSALQKNALLLDKVILNRTLNGIEKSYIEEIRSDILQEPDYNIVYENIERYDNLIKVSQDSKISIQIDCENEGEGYFYSDSIVLMPESYTTVGHVYFGDVYCEFKSEYAQYQHGVDETLVCLGEIKQGTNVIDITFGEEAIYKVEESSIYLLDTQIQNMFNSERRNDTWENVEITSNRIRGDINNGKNGIMFLGIPYSDGWKAYINGKTVPIVRANYGFMALELGAGDNDVELKYTLPGLKLGIVLSTVSMIAVFYIVLRRKNEEKMGKTINVFRHE